MDAVNVRDAIARTAKSIYASESLVYLTTGIVDLYDDAEIDTEAAIVKVSPNSKLKKHFTLFSNLI